MNIKLYHGTSSANYEKIKQNGFLNPGYLTSDCEQAQYYAECVSEEDSTSPVILTVLVDTKELRADTASYNEPLSYILENNGYTEDDWHEAIENNEVVYPGDKQWHISLETVKCVKNIGNILLENITYDGCLSETDEKDIISAIEAQYQKSKIKPLVG